MKEKLLKISDLAPVRLNPHIIHALSPSPSFFSWYRSGMSKAVHVAYSETRKPTIPVKVVTESKI